MTHWRRCRTGWLLPILAVLVLGACSGGEAPPASEPEQPPAAETFSFFDLFPFEKGYTVYYEGNPDFQAVETVVNVEQVFKEKREEVLHMEGREERIDGSDRSYVYRLLVTEDRVIWQRGETESVLLQAPLAEGASWETPWRAEGLGGFRARVEVEAVYDKAVSLIVKPADPAADGVPEAYEEILYLETEAGIASRTRSGFFDDGPGVETGRWIAKTSQIPESDFVSRYVAPPEALRPLFRRDNFHYEGLIDEERKNLSSNGFETDGDLYDAYKFFLEKLDGVDLRTVRTAAEAGVLYASRAEDPTPLVHAFKGYYEETVNANAFKEALVTTSDWQALYRYDQEENRAILMDPESVEAGIPRIKAEVFEENGVGICFAEGMPYLCPDPGFLREVFEGVETPKLGAYLDLVVWEYRHAPLVSDGGLRVGWDALAEQIRALERYAQAWEGSPTGFWAAAKARERFELYAVPNQFLPNTPKYKSGIVTPAVLESYRGYVDRYPESAYGEELQEILAFLYRHNGRYSLELETYLQARNHAPDIGDFVKTAIREQRLQLEDLRALYDDYGKISTWNPDTEVLATVEVDSAEALLDAVAPDTRIVLKAGSYILPYEYDAPHAVTRFGETLISGVDNLVIEGEGDIPVDLLSEAYGFVFRLENCSGIVLKNLRMGHLQEFCKAGVLKFEASSGLRVLNSILFGCGEWGLEARSVRDLVLDKSLVVDCASNALRLFDSEAVTISGTHFARNGINVVWMENVRQVVFYQVKAFQNDKAYYDRPDAVFEINGSEEILMENSFFTKKSGQELFAGDSAEAVLIK